MIKGILTKIIVLLGVVVLVHSVFWFFKTGQTEKHINNFVSENSANVSVGAIQVSGYPFSQKITIDDLRFSLPNSALNKNKIVVQKLEMNSSIFANDFIVLLSGAVSIQGLEGDMKTVEFSQTPTISLSLQDGEILKFSYEDLGYRVFDAERNIKYSALSSLVKIDSKIMENEQIVSKISVRIKEIEGFDLVDIYKNSFEKTIIDAIKTGDIKIGSVDAAAQEAALQGIEVGVDGVAVQVPGIVASQVVVPNAQVNQAAVPVALPVVAKQEKIVAQDIAAVPNVNKINNGAKVAAMQGKGGAATASAVAAVPVASSAPEAAVALPQQVAQSAQALPAVAQKPVAAVANQVAAPVADSVSGVGDIATSTIQDSVVDQAQVASSQIDQVLAENKVLKSDFSLEMEYILSPNKSELSAPLDPAQIGAVSTQYNRKFKINNFEFSNSLYKISLNGQVDYYQDDNMPSGFVSIKVDNLVQLVQYLQDGLRKIAIKENATLQSFDASAIGEISDDAYKNFLNKVSDRLPEVVAEISVKNPLSEGDSMVLDLRREKNLEFVVNDTSLREIGGKF